MVAAGYRRLIMINVRLAMLGILLTTTSFIVSSDTAINSTTKRNHSFAADELESDLMYFEHYGLPASKNGLDLQRSKIFLKAVKNDDASTIRVLLKEGMNPNAVIEQLIIVPQCWRGLFLFPLVLIAEMDERFEIVDLLVEYGAERDTLPKLWGGEERPDMPINLGDL
jgi:hypothetical protein